MPLLAGEALQDEPSSVQLAHGLGAPSSGTAGTLYFSNLRLVWEASPESDVGGRARSHSLGGGRDAGAARPVTVALNAIDRLRKLKPQAGAEATKLAGGKKEVSLRRPLRSSGYSC